MLGSAALICWPPILPRGDDADIRPLENGWDTAYVCSLACLHIIMNILIFTSPQRSKDTVKVGYVTHVESDRDRYALC